MGKSRRAIVSVQLSPLERVAVHQAAQLARLTVSNYLRRCLNIALAEAPDGRVVAEKARGRPTQFGPQHIARMRYFRDCGLSVRQIARRLDCSSTLVQQRIGRTQ